MCLLAPVEGDGLVNDGIDRVNPDQVEYGVAQGVLLSDVAGQINVSPPDVLLLHQAGQQVTGVNIDKSETHSLYIHCRHSINSWLNLYTWRMSLAVFQSRSPGGARADSRGRSG